MWYRFQCALPRAHAYHAARLCVASRVPVTGRSVLAAALAYGLVAQPVAGQASSPAGKASAVLRGVAVDSAGAPLAYATVRVEALGRDALTDARGHFVFGGVPVGRHAVMVRQVGFSPARRVLEAAAGESAAVRDTVRLVRLVVRLAEVEVRPDQPCHAGGIVATDSATAGPLFTQLRLNAERLRLVAAGGPEVRRYARVREYVGANGAVVASRADTLLVRPAALQPYAPGRAAYRVGRREWNLAMPTPDIVADAAFERSHCLRYAGPDTVGGRDAHRIEFAAVEGVGGPDVAGALWLDAATFELRRASFRLVNAPAAELPETEIDTRYGTASDGRPVYIATTLRYRQPKSARVDDRAYVRIVEQTHIIP